MNFERRVATMVGLAVVVFVMAIVWRNEPIVDQNLAVLIRIVLSLAMGILGATVPGFVNLTWRGAGLGVRAGGALALFVLTLVYTTTVITQVNKVQINQGQNNLNIKDK